MFLSLEFTMATETKFQDKSARVILVDSSGAVRQLLSEVAKSIGFPNSQAVASIQDAHSILETEDVDWMIVPLASDQEVNGFHTLRMMSSFSELKNVRVSLLVDEGEMWCLPKAFELGLLSYHMKPFTKDSLKKDLEEFLRIFESNEWNSTRTSAEYLRKNLITTKSTGELLQLERTLLEMFPGNGKQLMNLAQAQHLSGQTDVAKTTLKQVVAIEPGLQASVDQKATELFGSKDLTAQAGEGAVGNVLGLNKVVIIDSDSAASANTKGIFTELGVTDIQEFSDGEQAWSSIDAGEEPSLIVMEWRVPSLTGPLLLQRLRSKGFLRVPVVVQSSLIKPTDMPIIREMGVANLIQKPLERSQILKAVIWTVQQDRMPTEQQTLENKIRAFLNAKNITEAEALIGRYLAEQSIADGRKNVIRAELAFAKDQYEAARDFAIESLKGTSESIFALNVLGKSLMILRQFDAALKCFQKAQSLSPVNLERLVTMAETQAEMGNIEAAEENVAKAKDIDPDSNTTKEGEIKVALASGSPEAAKKMLGQIESIGNVISYLNNKAVAHSKCGFMEEGIDIYKKTLDSVPEEKLDVRSVVTYNMALAKIRKGDLADALLDLDAVIAIPGAKVAKKAQSLKERLQSSLSNNTTFALRESDNSSPAAPAPEGPVNDESKAADASTIAAAVVETTAGDLCCYLVFKTTAEDSANLKKLMATPPKFKARKAIARAESINSAG